MALHTRPPLGVAPRAPARVTLWAVTALVAATGAYLLHHLAPLGEHQLLTAAVVVGAGTALGGLGGLLAAAHRHALPPEVLLIRPGDLEVRPTGDGDVEAVASLHADGLSLGFFVELGPAFLRAYHRAFSASPEAVSLVAVGRGGQVVGAISGVLRPQAHMRWMLQRRGASLAALALLSLPLHPRAAWRFLRSRLRRYLAGWRRHRSSSAETASPASSRAVLSHVVVAPGARGAGLGQRLVERFVEEGRRSGLRRFTLTTLEGEAGAGRFYETLGWQRAGSRVDADGTRVAVFHLDLPGEAK